MHSSQKHDLYKRHQHLKLCRVCEIDDSHLHQFIFCEVCDDAYHWHCVTPPLTAGEVKKIKIWKCPECWQNQSYPKAPTRPPQKKCYECLRSFLKFPNQSIQALSVDKKNNFQVVEVKTCNISFKVCRYCQHYFHAMECFSPRQNSLNCWDCQKRIRAACPKSHLEFVENFLQQSIEQREKKGLLQLYPLHLKAHTKLEYLGLKLFPGCSNWESICRSEASLYYALKTNNSYYCQGQLYQSKQLMKFNQFVYNMVAACELYPKDELVYEKFLIKSKKELPPLQIKQDYIKGFYVVAVQFIQKMTILCEYAGQVCTRREANKKHQDNDSVMSLLVSDFASRSLDIIPINFGNFSRFISGVPNKKRHLVNIQTLTFAYKGRLHIIFYTSKDIERHQVLYIDYNSGLFQEYPTEHFV